MRCLEALGQDHPGYTRFSTTSVDANVDHSDLSLAPMPAPPFSPRDLLHSDPICATFVRMEETIWDDLEKARAHGIDRGEETVTENFLLDVASSHPMEVVTFPFHKPHEAIT